MSEFLFKVALSLVIAVPAGGVLLWIWTHQIDPKASVDNWFRGLVERGWVATRDPDKLYQNSTAVAEVIGKVNRSKSVVVFRQLANTENLKQDQDIEYQRLHLRIVKVGSTIGQKTVASPSGIRVLKAVLENVECRLQE